MKITVTPNPNHGTLPASDKLGFGTVFTDHMFLMDYTDCDGAHLQAARLRVAEIRAGQILYILYQSLIHILN